MALKMVAGAGDDRAYFDGTASPLRTADATSPFTIAGWFKRHTDGSAREYVLQLATTETPTNAIGFTIESSDVFNLRTSGYSPMVDATVGEWMYLAYTSASNFAGEAYYGATPGTLTNPITGTPPTVAARGYVRLGSYDAAGNNEANVEFAHIRMWQRVLNQAQLETEMASATVVDSSDLWDNWELESSGVSGSGTKDLTLSGSTYTWTDGPLSGGNSIAPLAMGAYSRMRNG